MLISKTSEYALRSVVFLAMNPGSLYTSEGLSRDVRVPARYLVKVMQALARAGIVHTQRGKKGGYRLVRTPDKISLFDIIHAVDPIKKISSCPLGLASHGTTLCPLHRKLDQSAEMAYDAFRATSVASLIKDHTTVPPFRDVPAP